MRKALRGALATAGALAAVLGTTGLVSAGPSGAVFTTDAGCVAVNENHYGDNDDVYLSGGPSQPSAALPDGSYYVKVTEPNGTLLGTSVGSADETPFVVEDDGLLSDCDQLSSIVVKASDGTPGFDITSNAGGVYKVWVCEDADFDNSGCKTDNFKSDDDGDGGGGGDPQES